MLARGYADVGLTQYHLISYAEQDALGAER
jgi:hypothetical protein